jgi:hypothetical protein
MEAHRIRSLAAAAGLLLMSAALDSTRFARPTPSPAPLKPEHGVLFADDFSGAALAGWRPDRKDVWSLWHGMLRADLPDEKQVRSLIYAGDSTWANIAVDLDVCMIRGVDKGVVVRVRNDSGIAVDLRGGSYQDVLMYFREWPLGHDDVTNGNGTWNHLRIEAKGTRFRVFVNGALKIDRREVKKAPPTGGIALPAYTGGVGECTVYYDNVLVTKLD